MIGRISARFAKLKEENRAGLIPFIMGGDPDIATTKQIMSTLAKSGADLIEVGIPFSDPMADGPTIQAAGVRSLAKKTKLREVLDAVRQFRAEDAQTPVILMGYYNPIYRFGVTRFCETARAAGVDGVIIVDLPPEEEEEFKPEAEKCGIALIRLVAPTSLEGRMNSLLTSTQGFVYYISITGITGAGSADNTALQSQVETLKGASKVPVAVGFGVKTPQQAGEIAKYADAVVVGSALVDVIAKAGNPAEAVKQAGQFVSSLAAALKTRT